VSGERQRLAGKRVIVTGAARGLGREFALHLAGLGARVLAADVDGEQLEATAGLAASRSTPVLTALADVASAEQARSLASRAAELLGGLDALVNNAAVVAGLARRPFEQIPEPEWDRVLSVNVKGVWLCCAATVPLLRAAGGGSIVNLASEVAFSGSPGLAHYVTSKAAVIGLTRVLARELGAGQIRVNALAPGFIDSDGSRAMLGGAAYDTSATPLGRVGTPADLLGALAFLVSDESAFVSGQTLLVNGGRTAG
jgi:NAD(P)-dependent dehydrogenase (short-subunit alcohol dehydrogenase family)